MCNEYSDAQHNTECADLSVDLRQQYHLNSTIKRPARAFYLYYLNISQSQ